MPETQSEIVSAIDAITVAVKVGRPKGTRNKPDHKAGRPRKPPEEFHPSIWEGGRAEISVEQKHLDEALRANSSHCAIAMAIKDAVPDARHISVDLQTIRWTNPKKGVRYCFLTPAVAQHGVIIPFDSGLECKPVTFRMKPAFVCKSGAKRRHTPEPKQLRGTGLKVAEEQPHIPASNAAPDGGIQPAPASNAAPAESPDRKLVPYAGKEPSKPRQPRQPRAKISAVKPDGTIPVTLGGKLPPVSVLSRREFGLRALRR
jgi:hypothetical protein